MSATQRMATDNNSFFMFKWGVSRLELKYLSEIN